MELERFQTAKATRDRQGHWDWCHPTTLALAVPESQDADERQLNSETSPDDYCVSGANSGLLGVAKDSLTCDYYKCKWMPERFNHPDWFEGYARHKQHALYTTTNADYGSRPPNVHTMQTMFFDRPQKFTNHLGKCGFYRNRSLNTVLDKEEFVPH